MPHKTYQTHVTWKRTKDSMFYKQKDIFSILVIYKRCPHIIYETLFEAKHNLIVGLITVK